MSNDSKNFPNSSDGARNLLHMNDEPVETNVPADLPIAENIKSKSAEVVMPAGLPKDLPIAIVPVEANEALSKEKTEAEVSAETEKNIAAMAFEVTGEAGNNASGNGFVWFVKTVLPYVAIFVVGLGLYYFYFSDFSFSNFINSNKLKIETLSDSQTNKNLENLKADIETDYNTWISQFFVDVNDKSIIDMDTDVSGNGLTNLEKYLLNLNPKVYSTRGNIGDGQSVIENINPWTGKPFTDKQKAMIEKYINKELISNRITGAALTRGVTKFAQYVNPGSPYYISPENLRQADVNNPVITAPGGSVNNPSVNTNPSTTPPATPVNVNSGSEINQKINGLLEIPAYKVSVPLIWTQDVKNFDRDLKKGIVHYPGTALPGDVGTSYISGHSSGYAWDKNPYKEVFAILGQVKDGTSFSITATRSNGQKVRFNYVVERRGEYAADDQAQFVSTADSIAALSTCWPLGTTARRLVLFGKLTQTENL